MAAPPTTTYFQDADEIWDALPTAQQAIVADLRAMLTRLQLDFAQPADTTTTYDEPNASIYLNIRHGADRAVLAVLVSAERVAVHWPGGSISRPTWDPVLADTTESFLTGHNLVRSWVHARKVVTVDTEVWLPGRLRKALPPLQTPGIRAALLRRLPWHPRRVDMTMSFARSPALSPTPPHDRV